MDKKPETPASPATTSASPTPTPAPPASTTPSPPPPPGSQDVTAALLEVLRNVNREVTTTLELGPAAKAAVRRFDRISADLAVKPAI